MNRDDFIIRDYQPEDYKSLIELWENTQLTYPERDDNAQSIAATLETGGKLLIMRAKKDGALIGSSWMTCDGRRMYLHHFGIRTDYQRQGLGTWLAEESMNYIRKMKKQVKLEVQKDNRAAIKLYEKLGFFAFKDYYIYMIRNFLILFLFIWATALPLKAQNSFFADWDTAVIVMANTGAGLDFLSDDERTVILLTNLARIDGPLFAKTFLKRYLELTETKPNKYTKSLSRDLLEVIDLSILVPEKDLYNVARGHAIKSGKSGHAGHKGFQKRYKVIMETYMAVGENCDYGNHSPLQIVMRLLIDEDVEDLGHRQNMFDDKFNAIGVSIKPHKEYDYNCVMSFGSVGRSYLDYVK